MRHSLASITALGICAALGAVAASPDAALSLRSPSAKERAMILKADPWLSTQEPPICRSVGIQVRVSTVDSRYVRISFNNRVRHRKGCSVGDGFRVNRRIAGTRRYVHVADWSWTGAPCGKIPRRIALDLVSDAARRDPAFRRCDR